jgi:hypothetical protein
VLNPKTGSSQIATSEKISEKGIGVKRRVQVARGRIRSIYPHPIIAGIGY